MIKIHYSFILLLCLIYVLDESGMIYAVLICASIHELGHYLALRLVGGKLTKFDITALGGNMQMDIAGGYIREFFVVISGCIFNFIFAIAMHEHYIMAGVSVVLGVFNAIPIMPLDGGRALELILLMSPLENYAYTIVKTISNFISLVILTLGAIILPQGNVSIFLIGVFLTIRQFKQQ